MSDGELEGLVCVSDLKKFPREQWHGRKVAEIMTPKSSLYSVGPGDDLATAAQAMATANVHQLPVLEGGDLVGFVTRADIVGVMKLREELQPTTKAGAAPITSPNHPHALRGVQRAPRETGR
jgi:predicted transcriptional regulator